MLALMKLPYLDGKVCLNEIAIPGWQSYTLCENINTHFPQSKIIQVIIFL